MKNIIFFIFFIFLSACSNNQVNIKTHDKDFDFKSNTTFADFKKKLEIYSINKPYPEIDSNL
tara:strand:- start:398 stop:583 length:186 start_codon:yes stop_codon:yes gene_type:complete